ncbi:MAG: glycosyl hydrolase, partial [Bacteroidetes bacterium]|nr:glycosyl hydrolase [Bacteroidota bacterium]
QPTADLLSLAVDDQEPYWIYAAQNDNSHIAMPSQTDDPGIAWMHYLPLPIGEGGHTAVKPDGSVVYAADRSKLFRFIRKTGQRPEISVWPEVEYGMGVKDVKYRFYYSFPVLLSPHDPGVLYTAAQFMFRSTDEGQTWDTISPDLTQNREDVMSGVPGGPISSNGSSLFFSSVIRTIAESPLREGELWVGTDDSTVQVSRDGGASWLDVSPPDLPEWTTITAIDVSAHQPGTVYISGGRHRVSDRTPYLYKTTDYGNTWQRITNGIRENDYSWVIREDPVRPGLLYAGTETGAYVSFDAGASWLSLQRNLPPAMVMHRS